MPAISLNKVAFILLIVGISALTSCDKSPAQTGFFDENTLSIAAFLEENKEEYSRFWELVQATGLYHTLNAYNPLGNGFTLFLPTDEAFDRYILQNDKYSDFKSLQDDHDFARLLSRYHLVNQSLLTNEFPYGALPDTTATGDYLSIGIEVMEDTSLYKVNNTAPVIIYDIETTNGFIHVINEVLEPITFNSFEWLKNKEGYSILSQAFELSGLKDTMGIFRHTPSGQLIKNGYTVLAEHDSVFQRNGIQSIDDLIDIYHTPGLDLDDPEGGLYQFAAYHMIEGRYFLDAFEGSSNYNSYAVYPLFISAGLDIIINPGVDTFGIEISGTDTVLINYVGLNYQESNVNTKNGPIHFITEIMELYQPNRSVRIFQFLEDPKILESSKTTGTYEFVDPNLFELIWWEGPEELIYVKGSGSDNSANQRDYIELEGFFRFSYTMPKIMPGRYEVEIRTDALGGNNATIQVKIDRKRMGGNVNLTSGGNNNNPYHNFGIGILEFTRYEEHIIEINTLIPGIMKLDYIRFIPE